MTSPPDTKAQGDKSDTKHGYCNRFMDDAPGLRADCARHLKSRKRCEDCPHRDIHREVEDLRASHSALVAENERLKDALAKYGDHYPECCVIQEAGRAVKPPCNCGFSAAITPKAST